MRLRKLSLVIVLGMALVGALLWYHGARFVRLHTKLIFDTPRQCVLYVPDSIPKDFSFLGSNLTYKIEDRARVHKVMVSGTGTIRYGTVEIKANSGGIRVGNQVLDNDWCSYLMDNSGRVTAGEIRTAD
jgi:hypothetical protein